MTGKELRKQILHSSFYTLNFKNMTIHQLSIFIENRSGTLIKVLKILKEANIQIVASTIADTAEYGIYRLICSEPLRAYEELKNGGVAVALSNVFALELDDVPGRAADAVETFSKAGISIAYMYTFLLRGKGIMVFRTENSEEAEKVILDNKLQFIQEPDLSKWV